MAMDPDMDGEVVIRADTVQQVLEHHRAHPEVIRLSLHQVRVVCVAQRLLFHLLDPFSLPLVPAGRFANIRAVHSGVGQSLSLKRDLSP